MKRIGCLCDLDVVEIFLAEEAHAGNVVRFSMGETSRGAPGHLQYVHHVDTFVSTQAEREKPELCMMLEISFYSKIW
jgi:hypothetical protein